MDDLARNFELNPQSGLAVLPFYLKSNTPFGPEVPLPPNAPPPHPPVGNPDMELALLTRYTPHWPPSGAVNRLAIRRHFLLSYLAYNALIPVSYLAYNTLIPLCL